MQSLKSIRLAEVDIFFKQSFEQKKTDSTVLELRTAEVDADSVGSDTSLSAACRCCNS